MADIMIVDDEALVLFDLCMTVEELGHCVIHDCTSVEDGLRASDKAVPDAALLDIDVGGTPVWPLARKLKSQGALICFVSANSAHTELDSEFADCLFVDKPASPADIEAALAKMLSPAPRVCQSA